MYDEEFRYMKIHIFALRWRDEIRRSSWIKNDSDIGLTNDSDIGLTNPDNGLTEEEKEPLLTYTAQGSHFRCKKLSVINGSPEHNNVLKL